MRSLFARRFCGALLFTLLFVPRIALAQQVNTFNQDARFCSGRPWIDVTCNGADPTGAADSTAAVNSTIASAITNGWPVFFPTGTYKLTSKITINYQGQAANGFEIISRSAILDGRTIPSGSVLQIDCSGGTTLSPAVCNNLRFGGDLTILANTAAYVVVLGNTDFSDRHNSAAIEHLVVQNFNSSAGAGGIQANYVTNSQLWLSATTLGGSSSVGAVALEQVQTSRLGGWSSARGASAPGLLIEGGATTSNQFLDFGYDSNDATCISITSAAAVTNAWLAPLLPCNTAVSSTTAANKNSLIGPNFAGTNQGPTSTGISIIGRGSISRYSAPTAASVTLAGVDDGTIFTAANGTGSPTGFSAASLGFTLPNPAAVGAGYTVGFVSDAGKAAVVTPSVGSILVAGRQLAQLIVGGPPNALNFETAIIASDGANWRVEHMSQNAALLNGAQTSLPARWEYPGGPGYQATQVDNGMVVSSGQTSGGLSVTLPSTTTIQQGWMLGLSVDNGKSITLGVNGSNGGAIYTAEGVRQISTVLLTAGMQVFQFDGSNFHQVVGDLPGPCINILSYGAIGNNSTDNSLALAAALNALGSSGCILAPPGKFVFNSPVNYTLPATDPLGSITIKGSGIGVTQFIGTTSFLQITKTQFQSVNVSDMSIIAASACSGCTAISLVEGDSFTIPGFSGKNKFSDLYISGTDPSDNIPSGSNYWFKGIDDFGVSNVDFDAVYIEGILSSSGVTPGTSRGVHIHGDPTHIPVAFNFTNVSINLYARGVDMGPYTQGIQWTNGDVIGNVVGFYVSSLPGEGTAQLAITNGSLNNCSNVFVPSTTPGTPILSYLQVTNSVLITVGQPFPCGSFNTSLALGFDTTYAIVSNNVFSGSTAFNGVNFNGPSYVAGQVVHNMFNGFGVAVDTTTNPLSANSGGLINGNIITNSNIGIQLGQFSYDYVVSNNILQGNFIDLQDNSGSTGQNMVDIPRPCQPLLMFGFGQIVLTSASWSGGQVTFGTVSPHGVNPGDTFHIINSLPGGYNGQFTAIAGTTGSTLVAALVNDPGANTQLGLLFGATNLTYSSASCVVSILNRQVFIDFDYTFSDLGTSTGSVLVQLPNNSVSTQPGTSSIITKATGLTGITGAVAATVAANASQMTLQQWSPTGTSDLQKSNFTNTTRMAGRIQFRAPTFQVAPPP